jgi:hypothetical protein
MHWIVGMFDNTCINDETMSPNKKQKRQRQWQENIVFNSMNGCKLWQGRSMDKEGIGILNKSWTWFETKSYIPLKIKPCLKFHPLHNKLRK